MSKFSIAKREELAGKLSCIWEPGNILLNTSNALFDEFTFVDEAISRCRNCAAAFDTFLRRHHCRFVYLL